MVVLVINDISHVYNLTIFMLGQAIQINFVINQLVHFFFNTVLYIFNFLFLLVQQLAQIFLTLLFIVIHDLTEFTEMFFHLALDNLSVSLLNPMKVTLCLL